MLKWTAHVRKFLISTDFNTEVEAGNLGVKTKKKKTKAGVAGDVAKTDGNPDAVSDADLARIDKLNEFSFTRDELGKDNLRLYVQVDGVAIRLFQFHTK